MSPRGGRRSSEFNLESASGGGGVVRSELNELNELNKVKGNKLIKDNRMRGTINREEGNSTENEEGNNLRLALTQSTQSAQLQHQQRLATATEEGRLFNLALQQSEHAFKLTQDNTKRELLDLQTAINQSKGKSRESDQTIQERREREELEMVIALSLSETYQNSNDYTDQEQEQFEASGYPVVTRGEYQSERSPYHEHSSDYNSHLPAAAIPEIGDSPSSSGNIRTIYMQPPPNTNRTRSSFIITNPDEEVISDSEAASFIEREEEEEEEEVPPPAYDPLPTSSPNIPPDLENGESTFFLRPGPSPLPHALSSSYLTTLQERANRNIAGNRLSSISNLPAAGSFSTLSLRSGRRSSMTSSILSFEAPGNEGTGTGGNSLAASFYPTAVASAMGYSAAPSRPMIISELLTPIRRSPTVPESNWGEGNFGEEEDPFDERIAAVGYEEGEDYFAGYEKEEEEEEEGGMDFYRNEPFIPSKNLLTINTETRSNPSLSVSPSTESTPHPSSSSLSRSFTITTPTTGGLVDTCSVNAMPNEEVLEGITFGFIKGEERRPVLNLSGPFPDLVQLSRVAEGGKEKYRCFGIEGRNWKELLDYLMWHGNSRIESSNENPTNTASIMIEFYKSFLDGGTRVRCLIDILPTPKTETDLIGESLEPSCPNITIILPIRLDLPLPLSTLGSTLDNFHSTAKTAPKRLFPSSNGNNLPKSLKNLPKIINLFNKLNKLGNIQPNLLTPFNLNS